MPRAPSLWLLLSLGGLACSSDPQHFGPPDSGTTITQTTGTTTSDTTTSSGGGGTGGTTSSGGTTSTGGTTSSGGTTSTGGTGGSTGLCMEDLSNLPGPGSFADAPSQCHCQDEAPAIIGAIAIAAKNRHDTYNNVGCKSAIAVPNKVPPATYYVPYPAITGFDFATGDDITGWLCLGVDMPEVIHCRYTFTKGSNPVSQPLGGPLLNAPEGFEIAAQGDADGDGTLYTYSIIGNINVDGDLVLVDPFVQNPDE